MPRVKTSDTRPKSSATYRLTVTTSAGGEVYSIGGALSRCLSLMGDSVYSFGQWVELDSYHKVRRELVASGGGYAKYYPANGGGLLLVNIIDEALLPAPAEYVPPMEPRPVDTSLTPDVVYQHPDFYSGYGSGRVEHEAAPSAELGRPVEISPDCAEIVCEGCKGHFYAHSVFSPRYCVDCISAAPSPAPAPAAPRPRRAARPLTDSEFIEAKARKLYEDAGLTMPPLPRAKRKHKK